jgi:NAD(P)-dependent dehydrogenase (short-subunit alcohol dehydrogenase family)
VNGVRCCIGVGALIIAGVLSTAGEARPPQVGGRFGTFEVMIEGFRSARGHARVALFNRDAGGPRQRICGLSQRPGRHHQRTSSSSVRGSAVRAAYQPGGPRMAACYGTKSYVLSFSKGLARELYGTGVSVTALCPGPSDTPFDRKAGAGCRSVLYRYVPKIPPAAVARSAFRGLTRQSSVQIPGLRTKVMAFAGELPPCGIALAVNRLLLTEV